MRLRRESVGSRSSMRSSIRSRGTIVGPRGFIERSTEESVTRSNGERASVSQSGEGDETGGEKAAGEEKTEEEKNKEEGEQEEQDEEEAPLELEPVLRPLILYLQRARHLETLGLRDITPPVDDDLVHTGGLTAASQFHSLRLMLRPSN